MVQSRMDRNALNTIMLFDFGVEGKMVTLFRSTAFRSPSHESAIIITRADPEAPVRLDHLVILPSLLLLEEPL